MHTERDMFMNHDKLRSNKKWINIKANNVDIFSHWSNKKWINIKANNVDTFSHCLA